MAYSGAHDATIAAVVSGRVDAAALDITVWRKFVSENKVDTLVGSTVHGVNYGNAGMAALNSAVGKFYTGGAKDKAGFVTGLVAAYDADKA